MDEYYFSLTVVNTHASTHLPPCLEMILFFYRRLSDAAGVDSECSVTACTNSSLSDEGTPVTATPPSTEPPITAQGEKDMSASYSVIPTLYT